MGTTMLLKSNTLGNTKQGIVLDKLDIKQNSGLRSVAKLCLNSFWGKFGQPLDKSSEYRDNKKSPAIGGIIVKSRTRGNSGILPVDDVK